MPRSRVIVALLALVLALPSAAFAQSAGDEQYGDPFGDEQAQNGGGGGGSNQNQDDGLDPEPPVDPVDPDPVDPDPVDPDPVDPDPEDPALPNTGSDPRLLAFVGLLFLMAGAGLRLRTLDPDDF